MGQPAAVLGDRITGVCAVHLVPGPTGPIKAPPLPFSAPIAQGCVPTVLIAGKPAAVVGSSGVNVPPHGGLAPADPCAVAPTQRGDVLAGSAAVLIAGKPAATAASTASICTKVPGGKLLATATTVLIG